MNYLFSESQSIGPNGTKAHGPNAVNAVISMIDPYLQTHSAHEEHYHLHTDNCVGQNKNRYVIAYLMWRVLTGRNKTTTLSFMRVGHSRCMVDGNFGLIKKVYHCSDIDTVAQLSDVVCRSSSAIYVLLGVERMGCYVSQVFHTSKRYSEDSALHSQKSWVAKWS